MEQRYENELNETGDNGQDRRSFLKCLGAWAGTGIVLTMAGGIISSCKMEDFGPDANALSFVQISDTHIGFSKDPNPNVTDTLQATVDKINALPRRPPFVIHTGDLTHLSKP